MKFLIRYFTGRRIFWVRVTIPNMANKDRAFELTMDNINH